MLSNMYLRSYFAGDEVGDLWWVAPVSLRVYID